jgi:cytochrome c
MKKAKFTAVLAFVALTTLDARYAVAKGVDVFASECAECHSVKEGKNKKGPSLFAVVGRKAGTIGDFKYSDPMKESGIVWTRDKLQSYIAAPKRVVPGGKMKYDGLGNTAEMAELLDYLDTLK